MNMKISIGSDRIAALLFLCVVLVYGWGGTQLTASLQGDVIGPAFFPKILTVLGLVLAVLLFLQGESSARRENVDGDSSDIMALVPAAMLLAYALVFEPLGYLLATPMFLIAAFRYLGHPSWIGILGYSGLVTAVTFALFQYLLDIRLPLGILARFI